MCSISTVDHRFSAQAKKSSEEFLTNFGELLARVRPTVNCHAFFFFFFTAQSTRKISTFKSYCWKISSKLTTAMLLIKFIVVIVTVASVVLVDSFQSKSNVHMAKNNKKSTALFVSTFDAKQSSKLGEHFHFLAGACNAPGFSISCLKLI